VGGCINEVGGAIDKTRGSARGHLEPISRYQARLFLSILCGAKCDYTILSLRQRVRVPLSASPNPAPYMSGQDAAPGANAPSAVTARMRSLID
jgi:hypothetical protein